MPGSRIEEDLGKLKEAVGACLGFRGLGVLDFRA